MCFCEIVMNTTENNNNVQLVHFCDLFANAIFLNIKVLEKKIPEKQSKITATKKDLLAQCMASLSL